VLYAGFCYPQMIRFQHLVLPSFSYSLAHARCGKGAQPAYVPKLYTVSSRATSQPSSASLLEPLSTSPPSGSHTCTMSESVPKPKPASMPEPAEDPWHIAFVEFKTRDEKMVKEYQEEIDTLLVFVRHLHYAFTCYRSEEPRTYRLVSSPPF
jgi:hypothetical protein